MGADELDTVAVQQDAASVHALATRALDEVDLNDPAVAVLAAWVAGIDAGIDETTAFVMPRTPVDKSFVIAIAASRGRRSALIAGSTVLALVVSGGAAAAVTGDPLALVRAPLHAMAKVNPFADSEPSARDRPPKQAPATASANTLLADAQRAMADGDTAKANELLAEAEALLGGSVNPGQQNRIDKLMGDPPGQSGSQQHPNQGSNDPKGEGPVDKPDHDPKGKGPVDKPDHDPKGKGPVDKPDHDPKGKGPVDKPDHDPKGKGPGSKETTEPSDGSTKGGSGKPPKDDTSKDSGTGSGNSGKMGSDNTEDPASSKPSHSPKSSPNG